MASRCRIIRNLTLIAVFGFLIYGTVGTILTLKMATPVIKLEFSNRIRLRSPATLRYERLVMEYIDGAMYIPYEADYFATDGAVIRSAASESAAIIQELSLNDPIHIVAIGNSEYSKLIINERAAYISNEDLMEEEYIPPKPQITYNYPSGGGKLTRSSGVYFDEWGHRETYYNLDMSYCVRMMRDLGYDAEAYPYWIREDGCKMLGSYVMIAANYDWYPKGTLLQFSLGTGIVVDTGTFVSEWPDGIDVCVNW